MKTLSDETGKNYIEIAVEVIAETDKALRVTDGDVTAWVPKSQIEDDDREHSTILIPEWLAVEKEFV